MSVMPAEDTAFCSDHIERLARSYRHWTGHDLVPGDYSPFEQARQIWTAPFAIASHDGGADPVFNYGNQTALRLFEMSWDEFTRLPSRLSAEAPERGERERLLQQVAQHGYATNYSGIRISSTGRRFMIRNAVVWNVLDEAGQRIGQAVRFDTWEPV